MEFMPWPLPKESSNALAISLIEDAINAKNYKFLEDLCKIFLHNERGANNNGQLLVADVLGNFAAQLLGWGNWTGNKEHAGKIVATFLNFARRIVARDSHDRIRLYGVEHVRIHAY